MSETIFRRIIYKFYKSPFGFLTSLPGKIWARLTKSLIGVASMNGFFASLYFTFFSTRFYREHRAVLIGIRRYRHTNLATKTSFGGFRRNVHRIEKGLTMQPRRSSFAEGYIGETVAQYASARKADSKINSGEQAWARDVLTSYFDVVSDTPAIAQARAKFQTVNKSISAFDDDTRRMVPYTKSEITRADVNFEDLRQLFIERRSVRWFEKRSVPTELLGKAIEAASWAPTACNRLPYRFHAFHGAKAVEVAKLAGGTAGWADNIPCLIVVVGDLSNYIEVRDRHLIYIDGALASMQLILALQSLGLSSVSINWPDVEERENCMQDMLSLPVHERPIMLIGVGYGRDDGLIPYSQKKPIDVLLRTES